MDQKVNKISGSATKIPNLKLQAGYHKKTNSNMLAAALNPADSPLRKHQLMVWDVNMLPMLLSTNYLTAALKSVES